MNNKGQIASVIFFIFIVAMLIFTVPLILRVGVTILEKTTAQLGVVDSTNVSAVQVHAVQQKLTGTMDWFVMGLIFVNFLVLLISAFLVDVNPAFVIIYIIAMFVFILVAPYAIVSAEKVYSMSQFTGASGVVQYIPMSEFLMNNFGVFIVGVIVLTGIIMYAKIKFFSSGTQGGTY